mmetsp:Transcript_1650/g.4627  ORF Transcript_1650/g.4627 Transcript_1650/m.4627 type:complete len:317 (+) Transcript_1650:462-1412(+)
MNHRTRQGIEEYEGEEYEARNAQTGVAANAAKERKIQRRQRKNAEKSAVRHGCDLAATIDRARTSNEELSRASTVDIAAIMHRVRASNDAPSGASTSMSFTEQPRAAAGPPRARLPAVIDEDAPHEEESATTSLADGFLRTLAFEDESRAPRAPDEASISSRATSAYTVEPTSHGQQRMHERRVLLAELKKAKKYGTKTPAHGDRWRIEYAGLVYITDRSQKTVITTYRLGKIEAGQGRIDTSRDDDGVEVGPAGSDESRGLRAPDEPRIYEERRVPFAELKRPRDTGRRHPRAEAGAGRSSTRASCTLRTARRKT